MKKYLVFLVLFGLIVAFTAAPRTISAKGPVPVESEVWEWYGTGVTGEVIPMYKITTTPREWYQLKSDGLKVNGATKICHGFDDGRYGWTGEIFRLVGDDWVKLTTTVGWVPDAEGNYLACAQAPATGTYALFGYFDKSKAPVKEGLPECDLMGLGMSSSWSPPTFSFYATIYGSDIAYVPVTASIINSSYPMSGQSPVTVLTDGTGKADFSAYPWQILVFITGPIYFTVHIVTPECYVDWDLSYYN